MDLTAQVRDVAQQHEMDYVGVAPVERLTQAPPGWRPGDILPGAASVIVMGIRIGAGVRQMQARSRLESTPTAKLGIWVYQVFGYNILNDKLNLAAYAVAKALGGGRPYDRPHPRQPPLRYQGAGGHLLPPACCSGSRARRVRLEQDGALPRRRAQSSHGLGHHPG